MNHFLYAFRCSLFFLLIFNAPQGMSQNHGSGGPADEDRIAFEKRLAEFEIVHTALLDKLNKNRLNCFENSWPIKKISMLMVNLYFFRPLPIMECELNDFSGAACLLKDSETKSLMRNVLDHSFFEDHIKLQGMDAEDAENIRSYFREYIK